jgi:bleomycin hydrolase
MTRSASSSSFSSIHVDTDIRAAVIHEDWELVDMEIHRNPFPTTHAPNQVHEESVPLIHKDDQPTVVLLMNDGGLKDCACSQVITPKQIARFRNNFDRAALVAQNAVADSDITDLTLRRTILSTTDDTFRCTLSPTLPATNQHSSGRCWLFATLNVLRYPAVRYLHVENFEFSESYLHFYDKLEKANSFLEKMIALADKELDDREIATLLDDPIGDGGDWQPAISLIAKYGLVPKSVFPETYTSKNTDNYNSTLEYFLISAAHQIRIMLGEQNASLCQVRMFKDKCLQDFWKILCIHLGTPPERFSFQWQSLADEFHRFESLTPKQFAEIVIDLEYYQNHVCLVQDPRHDYFQTYSVLESETVEGGLQPMIFLNVPVEAMKDVARKVLLDGQTPVWFACNVGREFANHPGIWDAELYDLSDFYGVSDFGLSKEDRIRYGYPMGTHAMLFTGVDDDDESNQPRKWRVENSWGTSGGNNGYYIMNDNWLADNVFEIVVPTDYLNDAMKEGMAKEPILLPPWDPMISSAKQKGR